MKNTKPKLGDTCKILSVANTFFNNSVIGSVGKVVALSSLFIYVEVKGITQAFQRHQLEIVEAKPVENDK